MQSNNRNVADILSENIDFGWMRQRSQEELTSFIDRRHAALETVELE